MTAEIIEYPSNQPRPNRTLTEPCQVLILPVVKIEHEDSIRAKRRRAYLDMKAALRIPQSIAMPRSSDLYWPPADNAKLELARRFGIRPEDMLISWDLAEVSFDRTVKVKAIREAIYDMSGAVIGFHRSWVPID